ncbi:MAG: GNAT family N-acetyltransferase [Kosmotogaceae bacterium]
MRVTRVNNKRKLRKFLNLPYEIYEDCPFWIPPLIFDEKKLIEKGSSIVDDDREFFIVLDGPQPIARLAVYTKKPIINANPKGYFTLFESYNDEVAVKMLFDIADSWFMMRKIFDYSGPESYINGDDYKGLLVNNFNDYPYINMSYNPPYYKELLRLKDLRKIDSFTSFHFNLEDGVPDSLEKLVEYSKNRFNYRIELPDLSDIEAFSKEILYIMDNSLPDTGEGMRILTYENIKEYLLDLKKYLDKELFAIAYHENQPIGFSAAIPNYNEIFTDRKTKIQLLKRLRFLICKNKIRSFRIFNVAVVKEFQKKGVSHALHLHIIENAMDKGYKEFEGGPINYDNVRSFQDAFNAGGNPYKEYALYRREIH